MGIAALAKVVCDAELDSASRIKWFAATEASKFAATTPSVGRRLVTSFIKCRSTSEFDLLVQGKKTGSVEPAFLGIVAGNVGKPWVFNHKMATFDKPSVPNTDGEHKTAATPSPVAIPLISGLIRHATSFSGMPSSQTGSGNRISNMEQDLITFLDHWVHSDRKDVMQDGSTEPLLQVIVVEVCLGLLSAYVKGPVTHQDSLHEIQNGTCMEVSNRIRKVLAVLQAGFASSTSADKFGMWSWAIAAAVRICANACIEHAKSGGGDLLRESCGALLEVLDLPVSLLSSWSGANMSDAKHIIVQAYSLDQLLQAFSTVDSGSVLDDRSHLYALKASKTRNYSSACSDALLQKARSVIHVAVTRAMDQSAIVVERSVDHQIQAVRQRGALLAANVLDLQASGPIHSDKNTRNITVQDKISQNSTGFSHMSASTGQHMHDLMYRVLQRSSIAISRASQSGLTSNDESSALRNPAVESRDEGVVGFTAAFAVEARRLQLEGGALADILEELIRWSLEAQAVSSPELQVRHDKSRRRSVSAIDYLDSCLDT